MAETSKRPTRELWRLQNYYCTHIRQHSPEECRGVIRQIQRLLDKGIDIEDIALALENYAADPWRKQQDIRYTKPIRSFFTEPVIKEWLTPKKAPVRVTSTIDKLAGFKADFVPPPAHVELPLDDTSTPEDL